VYSNRAVPRILDDYSDEDASLDDDAVLIDCKGCKVSTSDNETKIVARKPKSSQKKPRRPIPSSKEPKRKPTQGILSQDERKLLIVLHYKKLLLDFSKILNSHSNLLTIWIFLFQLFRVPNQLLAR